MVGESEDKCIGCGADGASRISPEAIVQRIMQQNQPSWSQMVKKALESLEKASLKECNGDRLCIAKKIAKLVNTYVTSIKGWTQWMTFDRMDNLTKEEMEWIYQELKRILIEFLEVDYTITKKKEEEAQKEQEKNIKKALKEAKKREKKQPYVS